jgi:hypothetical protein
LKMCLAGYEEHMSNEDVHVLGEIESSLKKSAAAFRREDVPFLLGGSLACWVRGGPEPFKDLDFMVKPEDAERALQALVDTGMRPEYPPEDWLLKAWDGDLLIDLIFRTIGFPIDDEVMARGSVLNVFSIDMPVMALDDVISTKLLALTEHSLDYEHLLRIARAVREQVNWADVRATCAHSPYARPFFTLLDELGIVRLDSGVESGGRQIRVVPASQG